MEIDFSKKEYRMLLDFMYLGDWMLDSYKTDEDPATEQYRQLQQKILSYAEKIGFGHLVEYSGDLKAYFPTRKHEDALQEHIQEYDEDNFWAELADHLAWRDLERQEGAKKLEKMDDEERMTKFWTIEDSYKDEFYEHGLEHVVVTDFKPHREDLN